MLSTEVYYFLQYGLRPVKEQYEWLEKDLQVRKKYHFLQKIIVYLRSQLQQATTPEALAERPWIIAMGHRPMYCSTTDNDDCDKEKSMVNKMQHSSVL